MNLEKKIYIAGHRGLVGSAIKSELERKGYKNLVVRSRQQLDLRLRESTRNFFETEEPDWVFLAAAKVGGIKGNSKFPTEFLLDNLNIQNSPVRSSIV